MRPHPMKGFISELAERLYDRYGDGTLCTTKGIGAFWALQADALDKERLDRIKKAVSIWNINSMAEFFMQILDKYKKDYEEALVELRKERERFYRKLCQIEGLKVYPSSANYFMCELVNGRKSEELAAELLEEQILIKDLTGKIANGRQYVRIAVRSRRENEQLAEALKIKIGIAAECEKY